jgi:imidazolonepropionase-like amidohydrolase
MAGVRIALGTDSGGAADLLVLEKNPLDNIANMRTIQAIYLRKKFE